MVEIKYTLYEGNMTYPSKPEKKPSSERTLHRRGANETVLRSTPHISLKLDNNWFAMHPAKSCAEYP